MRSRITLLLAIMHLSIAFACAQDLEPLPRFPLAEGPLHIHQVASTNQPFTVAGPGGAAFGMQSGEFELWQFPVKLLHGMHVVANLENYAVPLDLNTQAASIDVYSDHTTITLAHAAIVVKEHFFAPRDVNGAQQGIIVLFEINSTRRGTISFSFEPDLLQQWPSPNYGRPSAGWVKFPWGNGYVLNTDSPQHYALMAMAHTTPGIMPPYQERPQSYPLEFHLAFDPKTDANSYFPLLFALSDGKTPAALPAYQQLANEILRINSSIPEMYRRTRDYYAHFFDHRLTAATPDERFDQELQWSEIAIDQMQERYDDEIGLAAGWYVSGDSARPGYGWFFGRDTLWTTYALHSEGDFALSRTALQFLIRRQRADGKIMHEFANTSDLAFWRSTPYFYAAADSTPLYIMAMDDYARSSGDAAFIRANWQSLLKAYQFERSHTDHGAYDNTQGTGWVEEWPVRPHQESYLVALDEQSCESMSRMAEWMGDASLAASARSTAQSVRALLAGFRQTDGFYAFSRNADGSFDTSPTIFPSVAWWSGTLDLPDANAMLSRWASQEFSTDWGTRSLSPTSDHYDPITYHQGSVWPLYTGWVAMAEYRSGRTLSAYAHLRQNSDLTFISDLGAVTELLSGAFFSPLGRSSSHQLWSSAMVLTPAVRGLFGLEVDALHHRVHLHPALPADWGHAELRHIAFGDADLTLSLVRRGGELEATLDSSSARSLCLDPDTQIGTTDCTDAPRTHWTQRLKLPAVEVGVPTGVPDAGAVTSQVKVIDEVPTPDSLMLMLSAPGGSTVDLPIRFNRRTQLTIAGAQREDGSVRVTFPPSADWVQQKIELRWR